MINDVIKCIRFSYKTSPVKTELAQTRDLVENNECHFQILQVKIGLNQLKILEQFLKLLQSGVINLSNLNLELLGPYTS